MDLEYKLLQMIEEETQTIEESFIADDFDVPDPVREVFPKDNRKRGRPAGSVDSPKIRAERALRKAVKFLKEAHKRVELYRERKNVR